MGKTASREEFEKALRLSRRALPYGIGYAVVACGGIWGVYRWLHLPHWFVLLPVLVALPVTHAINIVYCRWRLRRLGR